MSTINNFRIIGILEGISYVLLVFIAMPLKYMYDLPLFVKYTGWAHGGLFVLFCALLLLVAFQYKWSFKKITFAFIASLLPFGTFFLDAKLKKEYNLG